MRNRSIKFKIVFSTTAIFLMIFGSIFFHLNFNVKQKNIEEISLLLKQNNETKALEISQFIESKLSSFRVLSIMPEFKSLNSAKIEGIVEKINTRNKEYNMEEITFIGKDGFSWINSYNTNYLIKYDEYNKAYSETNEFILGMPAQSINNEKYIVLYYPIYGYNNQKESLLCSAIPLVSLEELVSSNRIYNGKTWIISKSSNNIITSNASYIYSNYVTQNSIENLNLSQINSSTTIQLDANKGPSTLFISTIQNYDDWLVVTLIEDNELLKGTNSLITSYLYLFIIILILIILLRNYLSNSILHPIKLLQKSMHAVEKGDLTTQYQLSNSHDEIDDLGSSFNYMVKEINQLIIRITKEKFERKNAELQVLHEQIKPHFLYNTLDNIRWMARSENAEKTSLAIQNLSSYFKLSLNSGKDIVSLAEEIDHTKSYLDIQKLRYGDKLSYIINCNIENEDFLIPKIILQTLVENSIIHGQINNKRILNINIEILENEEQIIIKVKDNGIGISTDKIDKVQELIEDSNSNHYGLRSVYQRLKNYYFNQVNLNITSKEQLGTTITITINKLWEEAKYV